ncbi:hypothetical protein C2E23DRAFT_883451 [Lenzites betulinus]|nr:hypothetical protein C2E23DRAFT_883451 [Lenzites betulinus]
MLSHALRRAARTLPRASPRFLHATAAPAAAGKDSRLSQGSASKDNNKHSKDPQSQAARGGKKVAQGNQSSGPHDAASRTGDQKTDRSGLSGNQEGIGFADQVGSALSTGNKSDVTASSGGEGKGKAHRAYHTSAVRYATGTVGQAPEASRKPKEPTHGDQNSHLKHKSADAGPDKGKGNAGENPTLPSHRSHKKSTSKPKQAREFSTSARRFEKDKKHTADSYFKDVDQSPPSSSKTHQVDASATGSQVQRPTEPMTGQFSRAGPETKEYETVTRDEQYNTPPDEGPEKDQKLRYGNMPNNPEDVSKRDEGPEGASKGGRKAESAS